MCPLRRYGVHEYLAIYLLQYALAHSNDVHIQGDGHPFHRAGAYALILKRERSALYVNFVLPMVLLWHPSLKFLVNI